MVANYSFMDAPSSFQIPGGIGPGKFGASHGH